jgi:hypothetical protein
MLAQVVTLILFLNLEIISTICGGVRQGPLISDGRNSSKWTGHYVGWSKTLQMVKISE